MGARDDAKATHDLAAEIVQHLPGWRLDVPRASDDEMWPNDWVDFVREDGATIRMRVGGYRAEGRVSFYGMWPTFRDGTSYWHGKRAKITCSASRSPESIARDLLRRFLPAYAPEFAKAAAYVRTHDANAAEAEAVASRIAMTIGARVGDGKRGRGDGVILFDEPEAVRRLVVRPAYNEREIEVDFQVHGLDAATAAEVLAIIRASEVRKRVEPMHVAEPAEELELVEEVEEDRAFAAMRRIG
jgi:hypothetical protein